MILARRKFLMGLGALMAAPAIVSVANIMPVKAMPRPDTLELLRKRAAEAERVMMRDMAEMMYGDSAKELPNFGLSALIDVPNEAVYLRGGIDRNPLPFKQRAVMIGFEVAA